jgi:C-terminal processing protease CtpA/Prc
MITLLATSLLLLPLAPQSYEKLAPFEAARWQAGQAQVSLVGAWYDWLAIDAVPVAQLESFCKAQWPDRWQKRMGEDLVEVLTRNGSAPADKVELSLRVPGTTDIIEQRVDMTAANRRKALEYNRRASSSTPRPVAEAVRRVEREHATSVDPRYVHLSRYVATDAGAVSVWLAASEARADLDQLEWLLEDRYAYLHLLDVDYRAALDAVRLGLAQRERVERASFAIQLMKLLALFGDGHTRLNENTTRLLPRGYAPFLVEALSGHYVAYRADREDFVQAGYPYLTAIDGDAVEVWLAVSERTVAQGSPQFVLGSALRGLRNIQYLRRERGLEERADLVLTLANAAGDTQELRVSVAERKPIFGSWPRAAENRVLTANTHAPWPNDASGEPCAGALGYLRLPSMSGEAAAVRQALADLETMGATDGLIIDVRGNGGGSRDLLFALLPSFLGQSAAARLVNAARYKLRDADERERKAGYLDNRFLHPVSSTVWSAEERSLLQGLAADFHSQWQPPAQEFSDWHYALVRPNPDQLDYDAPVVILLDSGCFSATDIFLAAFKGLPNVTLMGTPSGGGSGRSQEVRLQASGLRLRLSSMASFQPTGSLYDGVGVMPDVLLEAVPTDLIGATDSVLAAAVARLLQR